MICGSSWGTYLLDCCTHSKSYIYLDYVLLSLRSTWFCLRELGFHRRNRHLHSSSCCLRYLGFHRRNFLSHSNSRSLWSLGSHRLHARILPISTLRQHQNLAQIHSLGYGQTLQELGSHRAPSCTGSMWPNSPRRFRRRLLLLLRRARPHRCKGARHCCAQTVD